ncbi:unnamed protein product [Callosobruchus maculatus]|nr:unnamed protein product [Callosobruchus maculatus]
MDKDECEFEDSPEYITISALTDLTSKDCNEASNVDVVKQENKDIVEYTAEEKPTVLTSKGYDEASKVDVVKQEIEDTVEYTAEVNELAKEEEGSSNDYEAEENAIMQDQNAAEGNEDARNSINSDLWRSADNYPACRICGAKFRYTPSRDIHEIVHNETMVCTLCDNLPFHKLNDLKSHVFRHLKEKEAELKHIELQCPYCRQRFTTRKIVMLHLRTHTDERPFKCDICGKAFRQMSSLSTHLVTHSKEKAYICKDCGGEYTTASSLKRHIRKMHNMQRSIKCAHCSLTFHNVKAVQEHRTTAHVNKLYKRYCSLCNEYFFSKINYSAHTKMHRSSL